MPRPGLVLDVERTTPPILIRRGEELRAERFPIGARVVYAPEHDHGISDGLGAARRALREPLDVAPLADQLRADMRLTIVFDVHDLPSAGEGVDPRQHIIEAVLDTAARAGVDDVVLVAARGLGRRLHEPELRSILGDRVHDALSRFGRLVHHDAEDAGSLTEVGVTDQGEVVEANRRVMESDLVVTVVIASTPADSGWRILGDGITSRRTRTQALGDAGLTERAGRTIAARVPVLQIETVLAEHDVRAPFRFLQRREREWNPLDRIAAAAFTGVVDRTPARLRRAGYRRIIDRRPVMAMAVGSVERSSSATHEELARLRQVAVEGTTDVVSLAVPPLPRESGGGIVDPLAAMAAALGSGDGPASTAVRDGGVAIVHHPLVPQFDPAHHPATLDFYDDVLVGAPDDAMIRHAVESAGEEAFGRHLYQNGHAFHPLHPFLLWRRITAVQERLGAVIVVGGDREAGGRLGIRNATTLHDALEIARDVTGSTSPTLTHVHCPPAVEVIVR